MSNTDLHLSVRGLGTWPFGGDGWAGSWGPQSVEDTLAAFRTAAELGVNWVDTAPAYGLGRAEDLIGKATATLGVDMLVATKCGERVSGGVTVRSGDPQGIANDCETSLRRLGRDVIDLYQLHHPPPDVPIEDAWSAMAKLVQAGKVRHIGLCNCSVPELRRCQAIFPVASYQGSYSPLRRKLEEQILPHCLDAGIGVLPYGALGHGFLTGSRKRSEFAADDWRTARRWDDEFDRGARLAAALADATGHRVPVTALTSRWLLDRPGVVATPIGVRNREQALQTFDGSDVTELMDAVNEIVDRHRIA